MKGAVLKLAEWPDTRIFKEVANGIPLIVDNAESLNEAAQRLYSAQEYRASDIIRGFAEEEAAKVLILLDAVRCPPECRLDTLKCYYYHLAKRIYALTCTFPNILSFGELSDLVAHERQPYYLDGPNSVDWIFTNSITTKREWTIYVDYVQDITETSGGYTWREPFERLVHFGPYRQPESVDLCRALSDAGADSSDGLAVIANSWRGFVPEASTSRDELRDMIMGMLAALAEGGHGTIEQSAGSHIVSSWSFPLWSFGLHLKPSGKTVDELRAERKRAIAWIEKTESRRDPPPAIEGATVEAMSRAYVEWQVECDKDNERRGRGKYAPSPIRSTSEYARHFDFPSYKRLESMLLELSDDERAALLALAWFTRDTVADWPSVYEQARERVSTLDATYQIGNGGDWLAGLERWETKPTAFRAGKWYPQDRVEK